MAKAMVALANLTLGSTQATVTFSSIPATYRDLYVVIRGIGSTSNMNPRMTVNADGGTNYNTVAMQGDGASPTSSSLATRPFVDMTFNSRVQTTIDWQSTISILDYGVTNKQKTILLACGNTNGVERIASRWASTSAITSIELFFSSGTWAAGSTFALYGIVG
jgi:hypothetical protein